MTQFLIAAHIGGTKARFGLFKKDEKIPIKPEEFLYQARYPIGDFKDAASMVKKFIKDAQDALRLPEQKFNLEMVEKVCLAVAGPITNNRCKIANWNLDIDGNLLSKKFSNEEKPNIDFHLINDFQGVAYGIRELKKEDGHDDINFHLIQSGEFLENQTIAVIGAATGLGKSFLVQLEGEKEAQAYATEGGHTNFAPRSKLEFALLLYILNNIRDEKHNRLLKDVSNRVSVERVVSGRGIVAIYSFLQDCQNDLNDDYLLQKLTSNQTEKDEKDEIAVIVTAVKEEVQKQLQNIKENLGESLSEKEAENIKQLVNMWQKQDQLRRESVDPAAVISASALRKSDPLCIRTMQIFLEIFATEVGNFALQFLPYGGLYVAGGITPQILQLIEEERDEKGNNKFLAVLSQKGRLSNELKKIAIYVLKNLEAGLIGAAYCAQSKAR